MPENEDGILLILESEAGITGAIAVASRLLVALRAGVRLVRS